MRCVIFLSSVFIGFSAWSGDVKNENSDVDHNLKLNKLTVNDGLIGAPIPHIRISKDKNNETIVDGAVQMPATYQKIVYEYKIDGAKKRFDVVVRKMKSSEIKNIEKADLKLNVPSQYVDSAIVGNWEGWVWVSSKDFATWDLNKTTNRYSFATRADGTIYWYNNAPSWWAINPSPPPFYTHWYSTYKNYWGPTNGGDARYGYYVTARVDGNYENYDWGNPTLKTTTSHSLTVQSWGQTAERTITWSTTSLGEDGYAIWGSLTIFK